MGIWVWLWLGYPVASDDNVGVWYFILYFILRSRMEATYLFNMELSIVFHASSHSFQYHH